MEAPPRPDNEAQRLQSLKDTHILESPISSEFDRITNLTKFMFKVPIAAISFIDNDRQWFKSIQGLEGSETSREVSFCGHAILGLDILNIPDTALDPRFRDNPLVMNDPNIKAYAGCPVYADDGFAVGSLCIIDNKRHEFSVEELENLKSMAKLVEIELLKHKQQHQQSELLHQLSESKMASLIDPLTRIWNREGISTLIDDQLKSSATAGLALFLLDIDDFKLVNDTFGHPAGDKVIREVAKRSNESLGVYGNLGRWGGEEFLGVIKLVNMEPSFLVDIIETMRLNVCQTPIIFENKKINVSITIGITTADPIKKTAEQLISSADKALYQGKQSGKNKCIFLTENKYLSELKSCSVVNTETGKYEYDFYNAISAARVEQRITGVMSSILLAGLGLIKVALERDKSFKQPEIKKYNNWVSEHLFKAGINIKNENGNLLVTQKIVNNEQLGSFDELLTLKRDLLESIASSFDPDEASDNEFILDSRRLNFTEDEKKMHMDRFIGAIANNENLEYDLENERFIQL